MTYKAIISDIDGTLIKSSPNAVPSKRVKEAIAKTIKKGIYFSVASARPYTMLENLIDDLQLESPIILNNGAEIYDTRKESTLWESTIPFNIANQLYKILKSKRVNIDLKRQTLRNPNNLPKDTDVQKFFVYDLSDNEASALIDELQKKFSTLNYQKIASYLGDHLISISISHADATKQHAVLKFAESVNISTREIIAIGDHYNDFSLFMACGLRVAMGNAVDDLKAIADYIAPSVDKDGVATVLEKFILNS